MLLKNSRVPRFKTLYLCVISCEGSLLYAYVCQFDSSLLLSTKAMNKVLLHVLCTCLRTGRMEDCKARVLLTCSGGMRANKKIELKQIADKAIQMCAGKGHAVRISLRFSFRV